VTLDGFHKQLEAALEQLHARVVRLTRDVGMGEPSPYLAILAADGDRMGETLSHLGDPELHCKFSRAQSKFAKSVRTLINGLSDNHSRETIHGAVAYAGADDILAFVPLHQCLRAARVIYEEFDSLVASSLRTEVLDSLKKKPTLSVGIAIGHFMEPLEDLLGYARDAEKRAKNPTREELDRGQLPRNGLALAIHPRGGSPFTVRDNWSGAGLSTSEPLDQRLLAWAELHQHNILPTKAGYELRQASTVYEAWDNQTNAGSQRLRKAVQLDALRILGRKRGSVNGHVSRQKLRDLIDGGASVAGRLETNGRHGIQNSADLENLALELIASQWIGDALRQASGPQQSADNKTVLAQESAAGGVR
jgi:CRISPR-associated protein Cmr2